MTSAPLIKERSRAVPGLGARTAHVRLGLPGKWTALTRVVFLLSGPRDRPPGRTTGKVFSFLQSRLSRKDPLY